MKRIVWILFFVAPMYGATFTVTNTNNSGAGSLLQAILDANTAGGNSTIDFNIPGAPPQIISPTAFYSLAPNRIYPPLTNPHITIDATTQPGFVLGSPSVIIDCNAVSGIGSCLSVVGTYSCIIKGIGVERYVNGGSGRGVSIESTVSADASGNQIVQCKLGSFGGFGNTRAIVLSGGNAGFAVRNTLVEQNVLSGNSIAGLQAQFNVDDTIVQNNYIGCNFGGTAAVGNAYGVVFLADGGFSATNNLVQNNVISGNSTLGVVLQAVTNNYVTGNLVGLNASQSTTLGTTAIGIYAVGVGAEPSNNNVIDGNIVGGCGNGIFINDNALNNIVSNNYVGTTTAGINVGNQGSGVLIQGDASGPCIGNKVESNTIRFNGYVTPGDSYGIFVDGLNGSPDIYNALLANASYDNYQDGIALQNNANNNQMPPSLMMAILESPSVITIVAQAPSTPAASLFRLDFFVNSQNRNPITEGARFIGYVPSVGSGQTVTASFAIGAPFITAGEFVSATATNLNNGGDVGDTSPYSMNSGITQAFSLCAKCKLIALMSGSNIQGVATGEFGVFPPPSSPVPGGVAAADL